jgi:hypothetical protein
VVVVGSVVVVVGAVVVVVVGSVVVVVGAVVVVVVAGAAVVTPQTASAPMTQGVWTNSPGPVQLLQGAHTRSVVSVHLDSV